MSRPPSWNRVKDAFQAVLERPAGDRAAALQILCAGDNDLRAEVEALLAAHAQAGSLGERPALEWLSNLPVESTQVASERLLEPGERLGPYEVESQLGAGGMGIVYRARDTRLGRAVAIKMLPAHLGADHARYQRFEREARAIASLDHPHIGALHDVGQDRDRPFLVMQYLDGETLAARLARGPLPVDQALRCAIEIANALDHAHRRGIVHRDLKPSNVMLTKSGAMLLDFGLAKWRIASGGGPASGASDPLSSLTEAGTILGTVQYMAPEQVEGREADERTDIFALGAMIYEMTTGQRAFEADTQAGLFAAIVGSDPAPISALRTGVPPALDRTVRKCLAKEPDARWQSASDLADELNWIIDLRAESPGAPRASVPSLLRDGRWWLFASLLSVLAAGAAWVLKLPTPTTAPPAARFTVEFPSGAFAPMMFPALAFSPDGRHLVYAAVVKGDTQLFVRPIDQVESKALVGAGGGEGPFFSPDGQWLGFSSGGALKRLAMSGGTPMIVVSGDEQVGSSASWGPDDRIVFASGFGRAAERARGALSVVSASGGPVRTLTTPDPERGRYYRYPEFLPGGKAVIFTAAPMVSGSWDDADIIALSLETGARHVLIRGGAQAHYASTGHLVYARAGTLFAVPFDVESLRVTGPPVAVLDGVAEDQTTGASQFTVSANGSLAYISGGLKKTDVVWVDRQGHAEPLIEGQEPRYYLQPRLSPDGRQLAIQVSSADDDIWVYDIGRETLSRFTSGANHVSAGWTPDGRYITFLRAPPWDLLRRPADGSGPEETILPGLGGFPHSWSPDGRLLTFTQSRNIWILRIENRTREPLLNTSFAETAPMISPDGRWLAYTSDETSRFEVYVQPFLGAGARSRISRDGGTEPLWARNGKELFFRQGDSLMAVAVANGAAVGKPQPLFSAPSLRATAADRTNYDVTPDGQKFVMLRREPNAARIQVVLNWADELKRRVPR